MGRLLVSTVLLLASAVGTASAASSELILNYSDPKGVELALGLLQKSGPTASLDDEVQLSDVTVKALDVLADKNPSGALDALLTSHRLVRDDEAPKTIIVGLNEKGAIEHVDFVGLVRGQDEALPAPDAVSTFVIRFGVDGKVSVIERKADVSPDVRKMKFSFEK
ncbi:hypothetical protein [Rhizobium leguminosarum]|uniref:hypothetical protein n=1 Tax=Rhizobium leguminosarum TaxID=384 RepID=UPI001C91C806|nr:hypothetical protein [Rhizobium leguminosarum]MBY2919646.1 hypothetical protein [Rhizobium leguminosarum]MBY2975345.1 hypothetical protein [Rhizobium leguminosarum]MBY2981877.1 hypothetical protein [Rhizobium leguminosarum]MBY3011262.1 hypothetical protein [Rhizobium leguminosarum]